MNWTPRLSRPFLQEANMLRACMYREFKKTVKGRSSYTHLHPPSRTIFSPLPHFVSVHLSVCIWLPNDWLVSVSSVVSLWVCGLWCCSTRQPGISLALVPSSHTANTKNVKRLRAVEKRQTLLLWKGASVPGVLFTVLQNCILLLYAVHWYLVSCSNLAYIFASEQSRSIQYIRGIIRGKTYWYLW